MVDLAISRIKVSQYKNLSSKSVFNFRPLTVLIGPNGSGKTNLINLLQFLHDTVSDTNYSEPSVTRFDTAVSEIGGDHILDGRLKAPNDVGFRFSFPARENNQENVLDLKLRVQGGGRKIIINEEILYQQKTGRDDSFYFYQSHNKRSGIGVVSVKDDPLSKPTHFYNLEDLPTDELTLVSIPKLLEKSQYPPENTPVFEVRRKLIDSISTWRFYNANNMNLQKIRNAEPRLGSSDIYLLPSAENLPLVLANLINRPLSGIDFEDSLNRAMQDALPWTRRIRSIPSGRLNLVTAWSIQYPGQSTEEFYLSDMSDGSVRMLCWACILLSTELPSLLIIEEPEIGIHVAWMRILANWIKQAATRTQVILSTHSPDLLDHFTENLEDVFVMQVADKEPGRFYMSGLNRDSLKTQLEEGWQLGDLYRIGDPTVGGWPW